MRLAKVVILVIVLVQLAWFILPRTASLMGDPYRNQERIDAFRQNVEAPSPVTKATVDQEMRLLSQHVRNRTLVVLALNIVIDSILVVFCWNFADGRKGNSTPNVDPKRS